MDPGNFLRNYWHKRPLLIRQALPSFHSFLSLRQLQSLARRSDVESRLVIEKGGTVPWQVLHGPLRRADYAWPPGSHWSLLVQGVNLHVQAGAELLRRFDFIPNWRVDDLMVSYAPDGGSVGAHLDSYDVFLLQAAGHRRWRIGARSSSEPDFIPGLDLRILRRFRAVREWLLAPGDMLYLPPGVAHHGIAEGECMTCSIGFRAPTHLELAGRWLDDCPDAPLQFRDAGRPLPRHPGEISRADLKQIGGLMRRALPRGPQLAEWFGRYVTALPEPVHAPPPPRPLRPAQLKSRLTARAVMRRTPTCRSAYIERRSGLTLFVNGEACPIPLRHGAFARGLCGTGIIGGRLLQSVRTSPELLKLCTALYNTGVLEVHPAP